MVKSRTAIIFGALCQDGYYLSRLLQTYDINIIPVSKSGNFVIGDVSDYNFASSLIKRSLPEFIFHLAAESGTAHESWLRNHRAISDGTLYILESVRIYFNKSEIFLSGSELQVVNKGIPIKKSDEFAVNSPYSVCVDA